MVVSRIVDGTQLEGYRFAAYNSFEEALSQVAHDQAVEGRVFEVTFWEGDRAADHRLSLHSQIEGRESELEDLTATIRKSLEEGEQ